jgi:hypothetical protein
MKSLSIVLVFSALLISGCDNTPKIGTIIKREKTEVSTRIGIVNQYILYITTTNAVYVSEAEYNFYKDGDKYFRK